MYKEAYLPVDYDFQMSLVNFANEKKALHIFYFDAENQVMDAKGSIIDFQKSKAGEFALVSGHEIRLDRMITVNGYPAPAYDEYDSLSNACMNCNLGYE